VGPAFKGVGARKGKGSVKDLSSATTTSRGGKRILLVEDDHAIREALVQLLSIQGFQVEGSENGVKALEHLRAGAAPDLIILDLRMPVMDGWEFRANQRNDPALRSIPVLAMSADGSAQAKAVHADAYLRKPVRAEELLATVARILAESERRQMSERLVEAERLAAFGRLAAGLGHEINNPLTYAMLNLRLIAQRAAEAGMAQVAGLLGMPDLDDMLGDALEGLERIRRVVDDLQVFARREDDTLVRLNLERVLDRALSIVDHELRPRARVVRRYGGVPLITANGATLTQLFVNLLANAAQAIDEGNAAQHEITVATTAEDDTLIVRVTDTGRGIPPAAMPHVFDPFFTTRGGKGTGLGLAICKQIVSEHGGDIRVASDPDLPAGGRAAPPGGRGTTVEVRLPRRLDLTPDELAAPPAPTLLPVATARPRLLVVDDEPLIGRIVTRALEPAYEVTFVESSTAGLARIAGGERFDLILCDLIMPQGGGSEMQAGLEQRAPELLPRLVFMTGGAFTPQARLVVERAKAPVLGKPFSVDDIRQLVARMLAGPVSP